MVHLGERPLLEAVSDWLTNAVFGPERLDYWRAALVASDAPRASSSARDRIAETEAEIADIERRIDRQVLALEDDDGPPGLRRRVTERVAELESAADDRRARLARLQVEVAAKEPTFDDVESVLASMPVSGPDLGSMPQPELRMLFDSLNLAITYHYEIRKADIQVTLWRDEPAGAAADSSDRTPARGVREEAWVAGAPGWTQCEPFAAGRGAADSAGRAARQGAPGRVRAMTAGQRHVRPGQSGGRPGGIPAGTPHRPGSQGLEHARQRPCEPGRRERRLGSVGGKSVAVRPGVSDALVMKVAGHLTDRDHEILKMLSAHRVFTTDQLCDLFFTNLTTARHRLTTLYQLRLVDRFEPFRSSGSAPYHYVLDQLGAMVVAADRGADFKDLGWKLDKVLALLRCRAYPKWYYRDSSPPAASGAYRP